MATFVRPGGEGNLLAINMDHVLQIEWLDEEREAIAVTMASGVRTFKGDQARRIVKWIESQAALPLLPAYRENAFSAAAREINEMTVTAGGES